MYSLCFNFIEINIIVNTINEKKINYIISQLEVIT